VIDTGGAGTALDVLRHAVDGATVRTAFGEPITHHGVTVVPVARVRVGGGGGGGATGPGGDSPEASGNGGGFGSTCTPIGVFVLTEDGEVTWRPTLDINKIIIGGQLIAVVALLTVRAVLRARRS